MTYTQKFTKLYIYMQDYHVKEPKSWNHINDKTSFMQVATD